MILLIGASWGCERPEASRSMDVLGGITTNANLQTSGSPKEELDSLDAKNYQDKVDIVKAIESFAKEKKLTRAQRLAFSAARLRPSDQELTVIHARTLLDLGRSSEAAKLLSNVDKTAELRAEIKFLTAVTHLSTIQRESFQGQKSLLAFIKASDLLYQVSRENPKYTDRFPPYTSAYDVRQTLGRYGERLPLESLDVAMFESVPSVVAVYDVLDRMSRANIAIKLLKSAHQKWAEHHSISILLAKHYLTTNERDLAAANLKLAEPIDKLSVEELLTYSAGHLALIKTSEDKTDQSNNGVKTLVGLAKSYHALLKAENTPDDSVFTTLIPRVKSKVISMLPSNVNAMDSLDLSADEREALGKLIKVANAK